MSRFRPSRLRGSRAAAGTRRGAAGPARKGVSGPSSSRNRRGSCARSRRVLGHNLLARSFAPRSPRRVPGVSRECPRARSNRRPEECAHSVELSGRRKRSGDPGKSAALGESCRLIFLSVPLVRVSHGIGSGLVGPSSMALVADTSTKERKGRAMALYGMSLALAVVIGFGIAGPVVARLGYPALFYVLSAGLLVGFVIAIPISEPAQAAPKGMPWRRLFSYAGRPSPAAGYAAIFSLYFILGAFVALVPLHLQQELGYGALAVGLSFTAFAILSLALHYPAGVLADRYGPAIPATIGLVAVAIAMACIPLLRDLPTLLVLMALFGVGHGFVFPSASALVSRGADPQQHGLVTGLFYALLVAGVAVGAPIMAAVASASTFGAGIWASAWISLLGLGLLGRALASPEPAFNAAIRLAGSDGPK